MTKAEEKAADRQLKETARAYLMFEEDVRGRLILQDLKNTYHFYSSSFNPNQPDDRLTAYREGQRSVVLDILAALEQLKEEK
jgi:hypothetical protein